CCRTEDTVSIEIEAERSKPPLQRSDVVPGGMEPQGPGDHQCSSRRRTGWWSIGEYVSVVPVPEHAQRTRQTVQITVLSVDPADAAGIAPLPNEPAACPIGHRARTIPRWKPGIGGFAAGVLRIPAGTACDRRC